MNNERAKPREAGRPSVDVGQGYEQTIEPKWDTLRRDLLSDTTGIDLDYRQSTTSTVEDRHYVRNLVGIVGILSFVLSLVSPLAGTYLKTNFMFALFTAVSVFFGYYTFIKQRVIGLALVYAAVGPGAWFLVTNSNTLSASILLTVSLIFCGYLAQKMAHHYAAWLASNPKFIGEKKEQAIINWRNDWGGLDWKAWAIMAGFIALLIVFGSQPITGFSRVFFLTALFVGVALFYATRFQKIQATVSLTREAIVSWFNYGRLQPVDPKWQEFENEGAEDYTTQRKAIPILSTLANSVPLLLIGGIALILTGQAKHLWSWEGTLTWLLTGIVLIGVVVVVFGSYGTIRNVFQNYGTLFAHPVNPPGVFQSPGGRWIRRNLLATLALFSLFTASLQFTQYAPVVLLYSDSRPWVDAFTHVAKDELSLSWLTAKLNHYKLLSLESIIRDLSIEEVMLLKKLEPASREQYLRGIQTGHYLRSSPGAWLSLALDTALSGNGLGIWAVLVSFVMSLFLPVIIFSSVCLLFTGRALRGYQATLEGLETEVNDWQGYVKRLQASPRGRDYLWLGTHATEDYPVILHKDILREHAHILGDSGSGKTALGVTPMLEQLIQAGDAAVVVIDLKGDVALFEAARLAAGERFKLFTNELGKATYAFNPFGQFSSEHISLNQVCEVFLSALALEHGEGYGRSYYSRVARNLMTRTLEQYPNIASFTELKQRIESMASDAEQRRDAFELIAVVESLAGASALNVTEEAAPEVAKAAIFMPDVLAKNQVIYFWLPPAVEAATAREIAKLAFHTLYTSAYQHQRIWQTPARVWLFIDEFQHVASLSFKVILQQARSMGIGLILANQTNADLWTADTNLKDTVQANTRFKQVFSINNPREREELSKSSGETRYWDRGVGPRLMLNDLIELSDEPQTSVVLIARGHGLTQYGGLAFPLRSLYHISETEYEKRSHAPWPDPTAYTLVNRRKGQTVPSLPEAEKPFSVANILADGEPPPVVSEKAARSSWAKHLRALYEAQNQVKTEG